jgi:aspartyl-tRNA(Asn)/glutamyl-tRNA(Gln) amidotransferase subunit C
MSKLSRDDVLKLAKLSRLRLSEEEIEQLRGELGEILEYVQVLDKVDTSKEDSTYQVSGLENVMRSDELINYQAKPADLLANAPATQDNQFKAKRVIE